MLDIYLSQPPCSREGGHRISNVNVISINHCNELLEMNATTGNNVTDDVTHVINP